VLLRVITTSTCSRVPVAISGRCTIPDLTVYNVFTTQENEKWLEDDLVALERSAGRAGHDGVHFLHARLFDDFCRFIFDFVALCIAMAFGCPHVSGPPLRTFPRSTSFRKIGRQT